MRVIKHLLKKKVRRDDDGYVYDPGVEMEQDLKDSRDHFSKDFSDFIDDNPKEEAYSSLSEFVNGV